MKIQDLIAKLQTLPAHTEVVLTMPGVSNDLVRMTGAYQVTAEGITYVAIGVSGQTVELPEEPDSDAFIGL